MVFLIRVKIATNEMVLEDERTLQSLFLLGWKMRLDAHPEKERRSSSCGKSTAMW